MIDRPKSRRERILELHEQGVGRSEIAERLGTTVRNVSNAIRLARLKRDAAAQEED